MIFEWILFTKDKILKIYLQVCKLPKHQHKFSHCHTVHKHKTSNRNISCDLRNSFKNKQYHKLAYCKSEPHKSDGLSCESYESYVQIWKFLLSHILKHE